MLEQQPNATRTGFRHQDIESTIQDAVIPFEATFGLFNDRSEGNEGEKNVEAELGRRVKLAQ
jgi:hypothetical protein